MNKKDNKPLDERLVEPFKDMGELEGMLDTPGKRWTFIVVVLVFVVLACFFLFNLIRFL